MKTGYSVADCMTTKPITCTKDISIQKCAQLMKKRDIGSVIVMDGSQVLGIVTEDDFVQKAVADGILLSEPVSTIMTTELRTISPGKDILDASNIMNKYGIHHLPVMEGEKMVGFITLKTVLKIEPQLVELLAERTELRGIRPSSALIESFDGELAEGRCESCGNFSSHLMDAEDGVKKCPNCLGLE